MGLTINRAIGVSQYIRNNQDIEELRTQSLSDRFREFDTFSKTSFLLNHLFMVQTGFNESAAVPSFLLKGNFPFHEYETFQHRNGNTVDFYPLAHQLPDIDIEMYEDEHFRTWNYFEDWSKEILRLDGTYNLPAVFKKDFYVFALSRMNDKILGFRYEGVWPRRISEYQPAADDQNVVTFTITMAVDNVVRLRPDTTAVNNAVGEVSSLVVPRTERQFEIEWQKARERAAVATQRARVERLAKQIINTAEANNGNPNIVNIPGVPL